MILSLLIVCWLAGLNSGLDNGLARTPPMGWLSWERFRCVTNCTAFPDSCISENLYMAMADKVVELGLKDLGYEYVNIDDCWLAKKRDTVTGKLVPDPKRFPSGIRALADYMHARGLKLGIYEDFGIKTCAGYPGSEFFMELDANTFAEWKVDMVKFDGCNSDPNDMPYGYPTMQFYMNQTGHPMLFSCEWPLYQKGPKIKNYFPAIRKTCNMWRNYGDVTDSWDSVTDIIDYYGNNPLNFSAFTGPGGWSDPDMLVVGDFGLSYEQQKSQFGMWAMFSAPMFMSVDLRTIRPDSLAILKNKYVIAINQDPLGIPAKRLYQVPGNGFSVWLKPLSGGDTAIAILNPSNQGTPQLVTLTLSDISLNHPAGFKLIDVFSNTVLGVFKPTSPLDITVNPTGIVILKAIPA